MIRLTYGPDTLSKESLLKEEISSRILEAVDLRSSLIREEDNCGRLINSYGDNIPGLIVDLYNDWLVVEIHNELLLEIKDQIVLAITDILTPDGILVRTLHSDADSQRWDAETIGTFPQRIEIKQGGIKYSTSPKQGTFHFFDQNDNRELFSTMVRGFSVLDTFCYSGAWGLEGLAGEAKNVTFVDSDKIAIALTRKNAQQNGLDGKCCFITSKTQSYLKNCVSDGHRFDTIVLDPPVTVSSYDELYEINQLAMNCLYKGGLLVTNCSVPSISFTELSKILGNAAADSRLFCRVFKKSGLPLSFPTDAAFPESDYLKCIFCRVY